MREHSVMKMSDGYIAVLVRLGVDGENAETGQAEKTSATKEWGFSKGICRLPLTTPASALRESVPQICFLDHGFLRLSISTVNTAVAGNLRKQPATCESSGPCGALAGSRF